MCPILGTALALACCCIGVLLSRRKWRGRVDGPFRSEALCLTERTRFTGATGGSWSPLAPSPLPPTLLDSLAVARVRKRVARFRHELSSVYSCRGRSVNRERQRFDAHAFRV